MSAGSLSSATITRRSAATVVTPGTAPRTGIVLSASDRNERSHRRRQSPPSPGRLTVFRSSTGCIGQRSAHVPNRPKVKSLSSIGQKSTYEIDKEESILHTSSPSSRRHRAHSFGGPLLPRDSMNSYSPPSTPGSGISRILNDLDRSRAREARRLNDTMVYLDGARIYSCAQCRTHLALHDDIISKSFHGRHGRAYLFDQCVNVDFGPAEDRLLITGLHSVSDLLCKRCKFNVGWTYNKAYESSQKYKEGKFIVEKINLHLEQSDYYDAAPPAGEKVDRWRKRSMSWGSESTSSSAIVYEYRPDFTTLSSG